MDKHISDLCDSLDCSVFSSDTLHDKESLKEFKTYLERWGREIKSIEKLLEENEKTCQVTEKICGEFQECGLPAVAKCKKGLKYNVCKEHSIYAMIAGWEPCEEELYKDDN